MLRATGEVTLCDEPLIGAHLGTLASDVAGGAGLGLIGGLEPAYRVFAEREGYLLAAEFRAEWEPPLRSLLLSRLNGHYERRPPKSGRRRAPMLVKDPNGSQAADLLLAVVPDSRLLFLVRDGRDVVDSQLDGRVTPGSWMQAQFGRQGELPAALREAAIVELARRWQLQTEATQAAFDDLPADRRFRLRYEDLLADPVASLAALCAWLELPVGDAALRDIVARLAFDAVPAELRGAGQFHRSGSPGAWQRNLSPAEQSLLNDELLETLERYGYA